METTPMNSGHYGHRWRRLRERWLEVTVDLDRSAPVAVETDMVALSRAIERIAASGGFALTLEGEGGPCADARLVVEDCGYELGAAFVEALGAGTRRRRAVHGAAVGAARAEVTIDLAGEAGASVGDEWGPERIDGLPAALAPVFFQALAAGLGARIAISVQGGTTADRLAACCAGVGGALGELTGAVARRRPQNLIRR